MDFEAAGDCNLSGLAVKVNALALASFTFGVELVNCHLAADIGGRRL
jgi:hypothetical protein